jgi:hypothetical protein
MHTIHKFPLILDDVQDIMLTNNSQIVHVGQQHEHLMMWVLLYTEHPLDSRRRIHIRGTGYPIPENAIFLNSVQVGEFVWHVFVDCAYGSDLSPNCLDGRS